MAMGELEAEILGAVQRLSRASARELALLVVTEPRGSNGTKEEDLDREK
jgi:hypothetical protein